MAKNTEEMASRLQKLQFRRKLFGGVDEEDLWAQMEQLRKEYQELTEQRRKAGSFYPEEQGNIVRKEKDSILPFRQWMQQPRQIIAVRRDRLALQRSARYPGWKVFCTTLGIWAFFFGAGAILSEKQLRGKGTGLLCRKGA